MRTLGNKDLPSVWPLLEARPVENLFVSARIRNGGLNPATLGCEVWGYERDGRLVSLLHCGSNLVPVEADEEAIEAFVDQLGPMRRCASIMGPAEQTMALYEAVKQRWDGVWASPRDVRSHQPMLIIDHDPQVAADERVRRITKAEFEPYFEAAVQMYTEEVGVSPVSPQSRGYDQYVRQLIDAGRAFGIVENGEVIYKSDIGSADDRICQVQGVWLKPELRGQGLSAGAMAQVVRLAREHHPIVSLYVNDYNTRARALYARVGFRHLAEFATVLY